MAKKVKKTDDNEPKRYRTFMILLWCDNEIHYKAWEKLRSEYTIAEIRHDQDLNDDGTPKKPHWHVVVQTVYQITEHALANRLGIEDKWVKHCKDFNSSLVYLIHLNDKDKFQYDVSLVSGKLRDKLENLINKNKFCETDIMTYIFDYIKSSNQIFRYSDISYWCLKQGLYSTLRRNYSIVKDLIDDHNSFFFK